MRPTCATCRYFEPSGVDREIMEHDGFCQRYPPTPFMDPRDGETLNLLPEVDNDHTCGEYQRALFSAAINKE